MIDIFLNAVYNIFKPERNLLYKFQGYFEIINQQRDLKRSDKRVWLTNVFRFKHFNQLLKELLLMVRQVVAGILNVLIG